jgi:hypothetical protein
MEEVERTGDRATFRINVKDLRFLKSVGIDPTRKVRVRRTLTARTGSPRPALRRAR